MESKQTWNVFLIDQNPAGTADLTRTGVTPDRFVVGEWKDAPRTIRGIFCTRVEGLALYLSWLGLLGLLATTSVPLLLLRFDVLDFRWLPSLELPTQVCLWTGVSLKSWQVLKKSRG